MHSLMCLVYNKRGCVWRLDAVRMISQLRLRLAYNRLHVEIIRPSMAPSRLCLWLMLSRSAGC